MEISASSKLTIRFSLVDKKDDFSILVVFFSKIWACLEKLMVKCSWLRKMQEIQWGKFLVVWETPVVSIPKSFFWCVIVALKIKQLATTGEKLKKFYNWTCAENWNSRRIPDIEICFAVIGTMLRNNCYLVGKLCWPSKTLHFVCIMAKCSFFVSCLLSQTTRLKLGGWLFHWTVCLIPAVATLFRKWTERSSLGILISCVLLCLCLKISSCYGLSHFNKIMKTNSCHRLAVFVTLQRCSSIAHFMSDSVFFSLSCSSLITWKPSLGRNKWVTSRNFGTQTRK